MPRAPAFAAEAERVANLVAVADADLAHLDVGEQLVELRSKSGVITMVPALTPTQTVSGSDGSRSASQDSRILGTGTAEPDQASPAWAALSV